MGAEKAASGKRGKTGDRGGTMRALGARVTAVTGPRNVELSRSLGADEVID